jgi:hypothetical protein
VFLAEYGEYFGDVAFMEGVELQQTYGGQKKANQASYQPLKPS